MTCFRRASRTYALSAKGCFSLPCGIGNSSKNRFELFVAMKKRGVGAPNIETMKSGNLRRKHSSAIRRICGVRIFLTFSIGFAFAIHRNNSKRVIVSAHQSAHSRHILRSLPRLYLGIAAGNGKKKELTRTTYFVRK